MAGKSGDNFGVRMLIIAYAAGIVLVGAHPIQQRYGSLWGYLKRQTGSLLERSSLPDEWFDGSIEFEFGPSKSQSRSAAPNRRKPEPSKTAKKTKEYDRLRASDRDELNSLIEAVAQ